MIQMMITKRLPLNWRKEYNPRPILTSAILTLEKVRIYFKLLAVFKDFLAWSYREMLGLSPKIDIHHLGIEKGICPIKQTYWVFRPRLVTQIEVEVNKLIKDGFIRELKYPLWISIIPVRKKNGQIRVCVDFSRFEQGMFKRWLISDNHWAHGWCYNWHEAMSFMDGSSGYNQIRMSQKNEEYTTFQTPKGIYSYKVMP